MPISKRITYVWQSTYPWDVRVEKICQSLRRQGNQVEIIARRGAGEAPVEEHQGLVIRRVGPTAPRFASLPLPGNPIWRSALRVYAKQFRPQLVIARDIPVALQSASVAREMGVPMVIDMAEHYPEAMRSWKKYQRSTLMRIAINQLRLPDRIERKSVGLADGILTVCEEMKQRLADDYQYPLERVLSVTNAPERNRFAGFAIPSAQKAGKRFGYHGVVIQDRDLLTIVRGFDLAAEKDREITLTIAGGGESLADIQAEVQRLRNRGRIEFHGPFARTEVDKLYQDIDFGIVSWALNPFSNTTIANKFFDYAACGKPMLFTNTRPMLRLMQTMRCGTAYRGDDPNSVADSMLALVQADYVSMARNGQRAIAEQFNWENETARMMEFLDQIT